MSEEAITSAFSDGVRDVKMKEEGRLSLLELPSADPEEKKPKAKDMKRKGAAVLAAEPDTKQGRDPPESSKGSRYCVYHDLHTHNTNECQELRARRDVRVGRSPSAAIGAMAGEEEEVEDDGKTVALAKGGVTDLARIACRTSLAREAGEISLVRITHMATQAFPLCRHRQGGTKTNIKTRELGASKSHAQSLASWVEHRPQPHSASSSSLLAR